MGGIKNRTMEWVVSSLKSVVCSQFKVKSSKFKVRVVRGWGVLFSLKW